MSSQQRYYRYYTSQTVDEYTADVFSGASARLPPRLCATLSGEAGAVTRRAAVRRSGAEELRRPPPSPAAGSQPLRVSRRGSKSTECVMSRLHRSHHITSHQIRYDGLKLCKGPLESEPAGGEEGWRVD